MLKQQSYELMRHSKRRKLTTVDFNNALQNADVQVTLGGHSYLLTYLFFERFVSTVNQ